ncbi:hypothetical protein FZEAL_354 [Fusarium zealandicum]|uniref:Inhibitor of growth protein N-terminal histone-binding domain-containing protein n=1 Tax=Fusarium zealandicum TaxID=1053134 RepID=A0A8H4UUU1_9HYPO|nr:hypothetical protein FZEAL_354 [Fusarium zealandicum]
MAAAAAAPEEDTKMDDVSPKHQTAMEHAITHSLGQMGTKLESLEPRADPDAQTTVTDFLDFTDYLPSDIIRSLTLIGKLDQNYANASHKVDELTTVWGRLPTVPANERPPPAQLRADISEHLDEAVNSRVFAHAEAVRMSENVHRHYNKTKVLLAKLQKMMENYPTEDAKSPVVPKSPQLVRNKLAVKAGGETGQKPRRPEVPRIIVPGEVQAPYEVEYDTFTDDSDMSSEEESDTTAPGRRTPAPTPRIKLVSNNKLPKTPSRLARPVTYATAALSQAAAANNAALLHPPPEDAVVGTPDAPWLQLTQYELAKLRKRMKKNATWTPSETMIARELKLLNRGPDAYHEAKKKAEQQGKAFEPPVPKPVVDDESGEKQLPAGAISADTLAAEEVPTSNRGMKLNEAKKLKREALAKLAAEEAEESARKMAEAAKLFLGNGNNGNNGNQTAPASETPKETPKAPKTRTASRSTKRKREPESEETNNAQESNESQPSRPQAKRTKTETPVPPPQRPPLNHGKGPTPDNTPSASLSAPAEHAAVTHSETPVPIPLPPQGSSMTTRAAKSPTPNASNSNTASTPAPAKVPPYETPVPLPVPEPRKSSTPVLPPVRENSKRETRGDAAKRSQQAQQQEQPQEQVQPPEPPEEPLPEEPLSEEPLPEVPLSEEPLPEEPWPEEQQPQELQQPEWRSSPLSQPPQPSHTNSPFSKPYQLAPEAASKQAPSRAPTPRLTPGPEGLALRRPSSRGKAASQEPQPSLAADRPRRASTARNTPAPEPRPPKRPKRPAPGVVSTTNSGGNSAVGKRKAAPKRKARARPKGPAEMEMVEFEVDDEGKPIDPDEARYCVCNRVSFGRMIECENVDVRGSSTTYTSSPATRSKQADKQLTELQNCKGEWFHLECVGLDTIPARTTKWYCPECRVLLNIGEKGEVSARGVKM